MARRKVSDLIAEQSLIAGGVDAEVEILMRGLSSNPTLNDIEELMPFPLRAPHAHRLDAVLFPGSQEDALLALRAMRAAGVDAPFIGGDATSGLEANAAEFPGVRYTAFFLARTATSPEARTFIAAYTAAFKEEPDQRAALAYDAAMVIGRGVLEVGANRADVRDYVESIGRERTAIAGAAGPIAFDANHDAVNKPIVIARVGR